jgi:hypothetical protein
MQSFSGPSPAGLKTIFYWLRLETPPTWEGEVHVFISPTNRVAQGYFFVASYDLQGYGGGIRTRLQEGLSHKVKAKVTSRLAVYRQSLRLGAKPLETQEFFFSTEPLRSQSLCNILSDEKMGLSLMNMLGLSSSVRITHIVCYWKFFLVHYTQVLCQSRLCKANHAYLTYLMLQRKLSHVNGRKLDRRQV